MSKYTRRLLFFFLGVALGIAAATAEASDLGTPEYRQAYINGVWEAFIAVHSANYHDSQRIKDLEECADSVRDLDLSNHYPHQWPLISDAMVAHMTKACKEIL